MMHTDSLLVLFNKRNMEGIEMNFFLTKFEWKQLTLTEKLLRMSSKC